MVLLHRKEPKAQFAGWAFVCLAVLFAALAQGRPSVGLSGLGAIMIISALLIEANKERIWQSYKRSYKYRKTDLLPKSWTQPNQLYYLLNVYVVWPVVFVLGLGAIFAAYYIS